MPNTLRPLMVKCSAAALAFWAAAGYGAPAAKPVGAAPVDTPPASTAPIGAPASAAPSAPTAPAPTAPAPTANGQPALPMSGPQVIQFLDQTIDWYRTLGIQQQTANEPSDVLILNDNRQTASRVMALAIEFARADADMLAQQPAAVSGTVPDSGSQPLSQLQSKFNAQSIAVQAELAAAQRQLASARGNAAVELKAKISELQGEQDLLDTRKKLLSTMLTITSESDANGFSATSLKAQIDAMAITAPPSAGNAAAAPATGPAPAASASQSAGNTSSALAPPAISRGNVSTRFGIWDLAADVFRLSEKISTIDGLDQRTAALQDAFAKIRSPLVDQLRGLSAHGDALATQADTADAATLTQMRVQLDALADQIKQESSLLIPLGKAGVLLAQYRRNLANWHGIIKKQYDNALKALGARLLILAALLAVVFVAAEGWRRAVLRYVRDARRRYQLLLLRKISLWTLTVVIVGFASASELTSLVTFAGLITAGLAVAMQSILVSIVGYFFLIGKYGIRVGDRVQFGDVAGEVIELGLVRMHLMELGGHGQLGPTGRVVAFANSIVFQVSSGLFKQIPGVNFAWHEIGLSLPAGIDYITAKNKLLAAVTAALKDSHDEMARQSEEIQRTTATAGADLQPRVQLNFTATGIEARIRYPVHLSDAAQIDDRVSQELIPVVAELAAQPSPTSKP